MKNHLKRIAAPKTWILNRKKNTFIARPNAGAHSLEMGLPLGVILRDELNYASSMAEVKKVLNNKNVLVDGKRRKDHRFIVGLFDVLAFPDLKKYYRLVLDQHGRIIIQGITEKESSIKPCKIVGKTAIKGNKIQLNFHDGKNIITDQKAKVGDTAILQLPKFTINEVLPLREGATVFLTKGKHGGDMGVLKEVKGNEALYTVDGKNVETAKDYLFVVGNKEAMIAIKQD